MSRISDISIIRHFFGFPIHGASPKLHKAAIVCLNASWWQNPPDPTTEFGIAEFMVKGASPTTHCENIINGIRNAHARVIPNAHLLNQYTEDGDSEAFNFGTTKFVSLEEAKKVLINTFVRPHMRIDLVDLGTITKVVDTQNLAKDALIHSPKGPNISLADLLEHFKTRISNQYNAGNESAGILIAALLTSLRDDIYMHEVIKLFKARKTHQTAKCLYQYLEMPPSDYFLQCTA
ncbi:hypothetical protein SLS61_007959 [Didymella pomorum]